MKKTVSISIDEDVWSEVKEIAWSRRESVSAYLEKLIRAGGKCFTNSPKPESQTQRGANK